MTEYDNVNGHSEIIPEDSVIKNDCGIKAR